MRTPHMQMGRRSIMSYASPRSASCGACSWQNRPVSTVADDRLVATRAALLTRTALVDTVLRTMRGPINMVCGANPTPLRCGDGVPRPYPLLGYVRVGEIPNYASFPAGRLWATVIFYKEL